MSTFEERQSRVREIQSAIETGSIGSCGCDKLCEYIAWLTEPAIQGHFNGQAYPQVCETVRLHMLRSMIEGFEQRGKAMQWWVFALSVAALLASVVQTAVAIRSEVRASQNITQPSPAQSTDASTAHSPSSQSAQSRSATGGTLNVSK